MKLYITVDPRKRLAPMGWLAQHLDSFVKPILGTVPSLPVGYSRFFTSEEMAVIKNMWRSVKREAKRLDKPILLAGRDVFVFEILARREGHPTVFRPDISRLTVEYVKEDYSNYFLFDTGFVGSIPRLLGSKNFVLGSSVRNIMRTHKVCSTLPQQQIFPRLTGSRSLILKIERTPKYWKRAFYLEQLGIAQDLEDLSEVLRAAHLTIEVYTDKSPALVEKHDFGFKGTDDLLWGV